MVDIIIVGYEDIFVLNSSLLPLLKDHYGDAANDLQLATVSDIEAIGSALEQSKEIDIILKNKIDDLAKQSYTIANVIEEADRKNSILRKGFNDFMDRLGNNLIAKS